MADETIIGRGVIPVHVDSLGVESALTALNTRVRARMAGIGALGGAALGGAAVAAAGAAGLFKIGETFEGVRNTLVKATGESGKALEELQRSTERVAAVSAASWDDIAMAVGGVHQRLDLIGKPLDDTARRIVELSRLTGTDLKTNIASMTRLFGDWSVKTNDMPAALDKVYRASQVTGIGVDQLSTLMVKFGSPLRQLGLNFDTTAAMFSRFEKEGVNIQTSLPGLRMGLKNIVTMQQNYPALVSASATAQQAFTAAVKEFGAKSPQGILAAEKLAAAQEAAHLAGEAAGKSIPKALAIFMHDIKHAGSAAEANAEAFKIFGTRAGPDMAAAIREHRFELGKLVKDIRDSKGAIDDATESTQTMGDKWKIIGHNLAIPLRPVALAFVESLTQASGVMAKNIAPAMESVRKFLAPLGPEFEHVGKAIGGEFGPAMDKIGTAIHDNLLPAFRTLAPVLIPVGKFLLDVFGSAVIGAIRGAVRVIVGLTNVFAGLVNFVDDLIHGRWSQLWGDFKQIIGGVFDVILGAIQVWWNVGILGIFRKAGLKLLFGWKGLWTSIPKLLERGAAAVLKGVIGLFRDGAHLFTRGIHLWLLPYRLLFRELGEVGVKGWSRVRAIFTEALGAVRTIVGKGLGFVRDLWSSYWTFLFKLGGKIMGLVRDTIPKAFKLGVDAIGKIWKTLKDLALAPVRFIVNTVYMEGIRRVVNAIPGVSDLPEAHLARGGPVHGGTPGVDSVRALLMPDEHVWTAQEVRKAGGHKVIRALRDYIRKYGLRGFDPDPTFAGGGPVGYQASLLKAQSFANAQVGKPYIWGGTGPAGFDCSGFMSAITDVLRGGGGFGRRYGTTATFPWAGFAPGPGQFTIGSADPFPGSSVGHMAGTLGGLNVESRGGVGPITGAGARGAYSPGFRQHGHMGAGGAIAAASGGMFGALGAMKDFLSKVGGWYSKLANMGGWGGMMRDMARSIVGELKDWFKGKVGGAIGAVKGGFSKVGHFFGGLFDGGGMWHGGVGLNTSGRPERVLDPRTTVAFEGLVGALHRSPFTAGGGATVAASAEFRMRIVNWSEGEAVVRVVARDEVDAGASFDAGMRRMGGRG